MRQLKRKKFSRRSLVIQFAWAFMLMSIIPLIMAVSLVFIVNAPTIGGRIEQARIAVFWMFVSSIAGYFVIRKAVKTLSDLTDHVRSFISGTLSQKVLLKEDNEIGELTRYFDSVTKDLESKIYEIEASRRLIQNIFHKIGEAVSTSRGIDSLLELILQSMSVAVSGRGGFIMFATSSGEEFESFVTFCEDNRPLNLSSAKIGRGILGELARQNKPAIIPRSQLEKEGLDFQSLLCVPLDYKGKAVGVMAIYDKKQGPSFTEEELGLLKDVASQTAMAIANFQLNQDVEKAYLETIRALAMAVEAKDLYSGGHLERVARYATDIGRQMGLSEDDIKALHDVAYLHDLGKIGIRDDVLLKTGKLTPEEYEEMKKHPVIGETIMKPVRSLSKLCSAVRGHQERWDGSGYPDGLKGEEIPLHARILAVADVYDALVTVRPYKKARTNEQAKEELKKEAGIKLDKKAVEAFLKTI